jgi:hypothetical protein
MQQVNLDNASNYCCCHSAFDSNAQTELKIHFQGETIQELLEYQLLIQITAQMCAIECIPRFFAKSQFGTNPAIVNEF